MAKFTCLSCFCILLLAVHVIAKEECNRNYALLGCYEERNPGELLLNDRSNLDWWNIMEYLEKLACKCGKLAKEKGYAGFALHYYGECYGRTEKDLEKLSGKEHSQNKCVGDQNYDKCDLMNHRHCTGASYAEAVYRFSSSAEENVNGGLGDWQPWTSCDTECGDGRQVRERNCDKPEPKGMGKDCSKLGPMTETKICKIMECPVNGAWSSFGSYGSCSVTCGGGVKYRTRTCTKPSPAHGGKDCKGENRQSSSCNSNHCPVPGGWTFYGSYSSCSRKCGGGTKYRYRSCSNPSPAYGGKDCSGSNSQSTTCSTHECPDIIGCSYKYTSWQTHDGGNMVFIDRHRMSCVGSGYILSMFHLERSGGNMRYKYQCCKLRDTSYCSLASKTTAYSKDGDGNAVYLDRHSINCGHSGYINDIQLQRNNGHDKVRYSYYCCNLKKPWSNSCYDKYTGYTDDGSGKIYYLDRQTVQCQSGYALSYYVLQRNGGHDKWRYRYRCCKARY